MRTLVTVTIDGSGNRPSKDGTLPKIMEAFMRGPQAGGGRTSQLRVVTAPRSASWSILPDRLPFPRSPEPFFT